MRRQGSFYTSMSVRRCAAGAGIQSAHWLFAVVTLLAIGAFLFDFVSPFTPTPLALQTGKTLVHAALAQVHLVIEAFCVLVILRFLALFYQAILRSDSDLLDLECLRRC